ncbi:MAG: hypothetical protein HOL16_03320 [Alphaproteobacteria bacterium]|nr:hypothetical protein [Alphaproteobacteria bacterium]
MDEYLKEGVMNQLVYLFVIMGTVVSTLSSSAFSGEGDQRNSGDEKQTRRITNHTQKKDTPDQMWEKYIASKSTEELEKFHKKAAEITKRIEEVEKKRISDSVDLIRSH